MVMPHHSSKRCLISVTSFGATRFLRKHVALHSGAVQGGLKAARMQQRRVCFLYLLEVLKCTSFTQSNERRSPRPWYPRFTNSQGFQWCKRGGFLAEPHHTVKNRTALVVHSQKLGSQQLGIWVHCKELNQNISCHLESVFTWGCWFSKSKSKI